MRKTKSLAESFYFAFQGIIHCLRYERNIRIHLLFALGALVASFYFQLSGIELAVILLTIVLVVGTEMVNTAVENAIDLVSPDYHPLAKIVKDVMAGAVFFACFIAVIVGLVIFLPYLWRVLF